MTATARRMGRPPLRRGEETKLTAVRMPVSVFDRILALVGPNRMAQFIREAIEEKLAREAEKNTRSPE
jgi:predicted DNA-binding protein